MTKDWIPYEMRLNPSDPDMRIASGASLYAQAYAPSSFVPSTLFIEADDKYDGVGGYVSDIKAGLSSLLGGWGGSIPIGAFQEGLPIESPIVAAGQVVIAVLFNARNTDLLCRATMFGHVPHPSATGKLPPPPEPENGPRRVLVPFGVVGERYQATLKPDEVRTYIASPEHSIEDVRIAFQAQTTAGLHIKRAEMRGVEIEDLAGVGLSAFDGKLPWSLPSAHQLVLKVSNDADEPRVFEPYVMGVPPKTEAEETKEEPA